MFLIFDVVILFYGVYTIYSSIKMKQTQKLSNWLVGMETASAIRDTKGYIDFIYKRIIVMGGMALVFGAVSLVNDSVMPITHVMQAMVVLFLAVCVWFYLTVRKAKEKYW